MAEEKDKNSTIMSEKKEENEERAEILKTIDTGELNKKSDFEKRIENLVIKGRKRGFRYSVIGIVTSILVCAGALMLGYYLINEITNLVSKVDNETEKSLMITTEPVKKEFEIPKKWKQCNSDEDCSLTQKSCCDCKNGGTQDGINNAYLASWNLRSGIKCNDFQCEQANTCTEGGVACRDNLCTFIIGLKPCMPLGSEIAASASSTGGSEIQSCCAGLRPLADNLTGKAICLNCGNLICESLENETNCPMDCSTASGTDNIIKNTDTDSDGLADTDELKYGTDPHKADSDGDGFTDGDEVQRGYDPLGSGKL